MDVFLNVGPLFSDIFSLIVHYHYSQVINQFEFPLGWLESSHLLFFLRAIHYASAFGPLLRTWQVGFC